MVDKVVVTGGTGVGVTQSHATAQPERHPAPGTLAGKKVGVLLVNLGTPDATDYWSMRRYLKEFLSDRRVVDSNRLLWWVILNGIILSFRPQKSGHAYAAIWDKTHNASPLRVITAAQTAALQTRLGKSAIVKMAMRYGQPSIKSQLDAMMAEGCGRILVAPLYPQYAGATTGTVMDEVARWLLEQKWQPSVRQLPPYYDDTAYIDALADSVRAAIKASPKTEVVVASLHGIPLRYCQQGDVYYCHSHKTARLLADTLGMEFCRTVEEVTKASSAKAAKPKLLLTFQSIFGREEWLKPYTDKSLEALAAAGVQHVQVVCPGFAADCVETLEEIAMQGRETFMGAGGKSYALVPCLNASKGGMEMLETLLRRELQGWV